MLAVQNNFSIHPTVKICYQLFCEHFPSQPIPQPSFLEVIFLDGAYYFFDNFIALNQVNYEDTIYIKEVDLNEQQIITKSWNYLFDIFLNHSVDLLVFKTLIHYCPNDVLIDALDGKPNIKKILAYKNISRKHWDYILSKSIKPIVIPSFASLIAECLNAK